MKRYNQLLIKDNNKKQIYQMIEEDPGICRAQIAELLQLSKTTVSALVDELIQERYVIDRGASESSRQGRRPNSLSVNSRDNHVIVINWHVDNYEIALVDTGMNVALLKEYRFSRESGQPTQMRLQLDAFIEAQCATLHILGICLIVPGMIDVKKDQIISVVLLSDAVGDHKISTLREIFTGHPLAIFNDTACFASAENAFGSGDRENYMYLNINDGVGAALISEGNLLGGASGMATQFGHISVDRKGYVCSCGNRGCLENQIGELALQRLFVEYGLTKQSEADEMAEGAVTQVDGQTGERYLFKDLVTLVKAGDADACRLMEHMSEDLAFGLCDAIAMFHPERIIIGGMGRKLGDVFLDMLEVQMERFGFRQFVSDVDILYTRLGESSVFRGAAKYYLSKYFRFNDTTPDQIFCG